MTPQAQTSERERQRAWLKSQPLYSIAHNVLETMDADAEKIRALEADAARYRWLREYSYLHPFYINGRPRGAHLFEEEIDAALAATQSPRSEAGEDK